MQSCSLLVVELVALLSTVAACSSSSSNGGGGASGSGGAGVSGSGGAGVGGAGGGAAGAGEGYALCGQFCDKGGEFECVPMEGKCVDNCNSDADACGKTYTDYVDCIVGSQIQCHAGTTFAPIDQCASQYLAAATCAVCTVGPGASPSEA